MTERSWKVFIILVIVGSLSGFIHYRYATGYLLGALISFVSYKITENFCESVLQFQDDTSHRSLIIKYGMWATVLVLCAAFPEHLNILMCTLGLCLISLSLFIAELNIFGKQGN